MAKVGIYWDEWYTWFMRREPDGYSEVVLDIPQIVIERYFAALNAWHDARDEIKAYLNEHEAQTSSEAMTVRRITGDQT